MGRALPDCTGSVCVAGRADRLCHQRPGKNVASTIGLRPMPRRQDRIVEVFVHSCQ